MTAIDDALAASADRIDPRGELAAEPARRLAVVTCMDARLAPLADLGLELGDAHVIRNAGARVTDDVLRSLVLSWHTLGTREVLVVQHSRCGARADDAAAVREHVAAAAGVQPDDSELAGLDLHTFRDHEETLRADLARIQGSALAPPDLLVRGVVHDLDEGRLIAVSR